MNNHVSTDIMDEIISLTNSYKNLWNELQNILDVSETPVDIIMNDEKESSILEKLDNLFREIVSLMLNHFDNLPFEFIFETLSKIEESPNLLNDDNGHWAVVEEGYQAVCTSDSPSDIDSHFFVRKDEWKNTPREALKYYLTEIIK